VHACVISNKRKNKSEENKMEEIKNEMDEHKKIYKLRSNK
jgi:hypothetical protein